MIGNSSRRRLAAAMTPMFALALLGLAACSVNPLQMTAQQSHPLTVADILQSATNVLNVRATSSASSSNSAVVKDLTFALKMNVKMDMSGSSLGSSGGTPSATQSFTETMNATGKETLNPRRTQMDMTMNLLGQNVTMSSIVDYPTQMGYMKISGLTSLPGAATGKWQSMSFSSIGQFGADTSMYTDYSQLKNAKLIGSEQLNGVAVWHVHANLDVNQALSGLSGGSASSSAGGSVNVNATSDYYFRQDNYRPVKVVVTGTTDLSSLGTMTLNTEMDFTSFNTGVKVTLPNPSDVQPLPSLGG
jgi:hypothetical protein